MENGVSVCPRTLLAGWQKKNALLLLTFYNVLGLLQTGSSCKAAVACRLGSFLFHEPIQFIDSGSRDATARLPT